MLTIDRVCLPASPPLCLCACLPLSLMPHTLPRLQSCVAAPQMKMPLVAAQAVMLRGIVSLIDERFRHLESRGANGKGSDSPAERRRCGHRPQNKTAQHEYREYRACPEPRVPTSAIVP